MTGEDLLRAVIARPEDEAPRLVYADYLQQQGDPQGELIAIQCRLANLATDDANRGELELRANALIAEHGATWAARLGDGISNVDYSRGLAYVAKARVRPGMLDLLDRAPIHDLGFTDPALEDRARIHDIAVELARDPRLERIEMLATGVHWDETAFTALLASPYLVRVRGLSIADADCEVYAGHALATARLPSLEMLALAGNQRGEMGDAGVAALARASLPKLRDLQILNVSCTSAAAHYLARSATLTELKTLDFGGVSAYYENWLGPAGAEALAGSSNFHALRWLVLDFNTILDQGLTALANSAHLDELRTLSLKGNHLGDDGLRSLALGTGLPNLETLDLSFNGTLTPAGIAALAESPRLATLSSLWLRKISLGPEAARAIAGSPHAQVLRSLNLLECKLGDEGARALLESPHLDGLTDLQLGGNAISEDIRTALHERWGTRVRV